MLFISYVVKFRPFRHHQINRKVVSDDAETPKNLKHMEYYVFENYDYPINVYDANTLTL